MKRFSMFSFLYALMSLGIFHVVDPSDGGGGDTPSSSGDDAGSDAGDNGADNDNGGDAGSDGDVGDTEIDGEGEATLSEEEIKEIRAERATAQQKQFEDAVSTDIQTRIPDFDMGVVRDELMELNKTDPEKAGYYNSPAGLELYWMQRSQNAASSDEVNNGAHGGDGKDVGELVEKARGGDKKAAKSALENSK